MKQTFKRGVSFVLAFMMVFGVLATMPFTAFAVNDYTINSTESTDNYYNLISKKDWEIIEDEQHCTDEKHDFEYRFVTYLKRNK